MSEVLVLISCFAVHSSRSPLGVISLVSGSKGPDPASTYRRRVRASLALALCEDVVAHGAGPRRCTAGVTPASVNASGRRPEARETVVVLCTLAMADHIRTTRTNTQLRALPPTVPPTIQRTCDDTRLGLHEGSLTAAGGPPRWVYGTRFRGLTRPSRRMFLRRQRVYPQMLTRDTKSSLMFTSLPQPRPPKGE